MLLRLLLRLLLLQLTALPLRPSLFRPSGLSVPGAGRGCSLEARLAAATGRLSALENQTGRTWPRAFPPVCARTWRDRDACLLS